MNIKELIDTYKGIDCVIVWTDSPDGEEDVFISFGPEQFDPKSDLNTFYYFDEEEADDMFEYIMESYDLNRKTIDLGD